MLPVPADQYYDIQSIGMTVVRRHTNNNHMVLDEVLVSEWGRVCDRECRSIGRSARNATQTKISPTCALTVRCARVCSSYYVPYAAVRLAAQHAVAAHKFNKYTTRARKNMFDTSEKATSTL